MSLSRFILPAVALILGLVIGFFANELVLPASLTPPEPTQKSQQKVVAEESLPVKPELLRNPVIYEWRGSVKGKLIAKSEDAIILEDQGGNRLTVHLTVGPGQPVMTFFFEVPALGESGNRISIDQIPVGSTISGDIFIFPNAESENRYEVVGGSFSVILNE